MRFKIQLIAVFAVLVFVSGVQADRAPQDNWYQLDTWGETGSGDGQFADPRGMDIDTNGLLYVADAGNANIQVFQKDGTFVRKWSCSSPYDIAVGTNGMLYVSSYNKVQVFSPTGTLMNEWGSSGSNTNQFNSPQGIAVGTNGLVYVADTSNHRIQVFESDGECGSCFESDGGFFLF